MERRALAVAVLVLASFLWGSSFIANDVGVSAMPGAAFAFWRFAIAALATVAIALALRDNPFPLLREPGLWALAAANAVAMLLQYWGQERTSPAHAALFVNASVVAIAGLSYVLFRERFGAGKVAAVAAAVAGAAIVEVPALAEAGSGIVVGDALVFVAGIGMSLYVVWSKAAVAGGTLAGGRLARIARTVERLPRKSVWGTLAAVHIGTTAILAPFAFVHGNAALPPISLVPTVAWTAIACTTVAYAAWLWALRHVGAAASAVVLLLEVVWAAILSVALGFETLAPTAIAGGALIVAASAYMALRTS